MPFCTGIGCVPIICSIVDAVLTDDGFGKLGRSSGLNGSGVFERNASTPKVIIHARRNPSSAQIKITWVVVSDVSMVILSQVSFLREG